nr:topless-related protein 3-like isoform X1 [Ipomoea batatas]
MAFLALNSSSDWSCGLFYKNDESLSEAIWSKAISNDSDSRLNITKPWQLTEIVDRIQCLMVSMPECSDAKVVRLLYTKCGVGLMALSLDGIHKLWKWPHNKHNPSAKATANSVPQYWQTSSGLLTDVSGVNIEEVVPCIALSNDGYFVASAFGRKVSLFSMKTFGFQEMTAFKLPSASTFLAHDPCGYEIIAIGTEDSTIYLYNFAKEKVMAKLKGHQNRITGLAFSSNPYMLVSSGADAQLCMWNIIGRWKKRISVCIQLPAGEVLSGDTQVMFHVDQLHLLVTHETQLAIYDASKMERISQWIPLGSLSTPISSATYSGNSLLVYASFNDGNIGVFDAHSLRLRCRIAPSAYLSQVESDRSQFVYPVVIAAHPQKTNQFAIGLSDGSVKVIEPRKFERKWGVSPTIDNESSDDEEASMAEDSDGETSMIEDSDGETPMIEDSSEDALMAIINGEEIRSGPYHCETTTSQELGQNRTKPWQLTEIVDPIQCRMVSMPECFDAKVAQILYTKSGVGILALSSDGIHKQWKWHYQNPSRKATANSVPQHWQTYSGLHVSGVNLEKVVPCIALPNDGSFVALAAGGKVALSDMETFEEKATFMCQSASTFLAFHPRHNNILAIGMEDSTINIYNVWEKEVRVNLKGHQKRITGLTFSTNLKMLVSSGADTQLCAWSVDTWEMRISVQIQLPASELEVPSSDTHVMFNADQLRLLVTHETQLAVYDASKMECISQWIPHDCLYAPISSATYSCNNQLVYASFKDGNIGVFDANNPNSLKLRCRIAPSAYLSRPVSNREGVYAVVIAAHPHKPNQLAVGLTNGSIKVIEPLKYEGEWGISPPVDIDILNGRYFILFNIVYEHLSSNKKTKIFL